MPNKPQKRTRKPSSALPPLRIQPNEFASFLDLSREINQNLEVDRVLQNIVEKAPPFFRADGCILRLLNRKRNLLEAVKSFQVGDGFLKALNFDEGISGLAIRGKRQVIVPDISQDPLFVFKEAVQRGKFLSAICVPLQTQGKVMGTLTLLSRKRRHFGEKQAFLLRALADQAGIALAKAGSYEKIRKQVRHISFRRQDEKKAKNFLQNIIDHSLDPIVVTDIQGKVSFPNKAAAEALGIAQKELLGREMADFYPGGREEAENIMKILLRRERIRNYETGLVLKGEKKRPIMLSASLLCDANGRPEGTVGIFKDVPPHTSSCSTK